MLVQQCTGSVVLKTGQHRKEALLEQQPDLHYKFKAAGSGAWCTGGEQAKGCHGLSQAGQLQLSWRRLSRI